MDALLCDMNYNFAVRDDHMIIHSVTMNGVEGIMMVENVLKRKIVSRRNHKTGRMTQSNCKVSVLVKLFAALLTISGTFSLVHGVKPSK
jgi:hypothetical protein